MTSWIDAVDFYRERFGGAGPMGGLFEADLVALNRLLSDREVGEKLSGIDPELEKQLLAASEVARERWPAADRKNQRWIAAAGPLVEKHGLALRDDLVAAFQAPWPSEPVLVDVSCLAGPVGAYAVGDPAHITISSCDSGYEPPRALEMLFHEASHFLVGSVQEKIEQESVRLGTTAPRNLWHALIFYTAGELTQRRLGPGYVPYAVHNGLWGGPMGRLEPLQQEWQPYLDGARSLDEAIHRLVKTSTSAGSSEASGPLTR